MDTWRDAASDLLLGGRCAGCDRAGRRLCPVCAAACVAAPGQAWPDPVPVGLVDPEPVPPIAAAPYDGRLRELVVAAKEQQRFGLVRPLGRTLGASVESALEPVGWAAGTLVPMPSSRPAVRERGHDAVLSMTRVAAAWLRRRGYRVTVAAALRSHRGVRDQAGLSASARAANLAGSLRLARGARGQLGTASLVVVDDVITTGASAAEAVRVLRAAGGRPVAVATIAATRRRQPRR